MKYSTKSDKRPAMQFYPKDWLGDIVLMSLPLSAQGLWIWMLSVMWQSNPRGMLCLNGSKVQANVLSKTVAKVTSKTVANVEANFSKLKDADVLTVLSTGEVICRRMYREWQQLKHISEVRREAGRKGGKAKSGSKQEAKQEANQAAPTASAPPTASASKESKERKVAKSWKEDPEFSSFVTAYPRHIQLNYAWKAWKTRLKEGLTAEQLIAAAQHYAVYCRREHREPRQIMHPSSFLGTQKRGYEDFLKGLPVEVEQEESTFG